MRLETKKTIDFALGGLTIFLVKPLVRIVGLVLRRDHSLTPRGDVVVFKLLGGGSLISAYPAIHSLRQSLQENQKLILVTTPTLKPFAEASQLFDKIYCINDSSLISLIFSTLALVLKNIGGIDTTIDLEVHSRGTALLSIALRARNRLGFFKDSIYWRVGLYTHLVFYNTYSCSASFYESLISLIQYPLNTLDQSIPGFQKIYAAEVIENKISLGFACSNNARERMLSTQQWVDSLKSLNISSKAEIHLLGHSNDSSLAAELKNTIEQSIGLKCLNKAGQLSLSQSIKEIASSETYIGIDSGLLHFARLLGKDCISFWGPTDPGTRLAPRSIGTDKVFYQKVSCSPCVHFASSPPCQGNNRCMEALTNPELSQLNLSWGILPDDIETSVELTR